MTSPWELMGNVPMLNQLSEAQIAHRNEFDSIMSDIRSQTQKVMGSWEGAGWDEKDADDKNFEDHYQQTQDAFMRLINATDETASTWQNAGTRMIGNFSA